MSAMVPLHELEALFNVLPDVVFFAKDGQARYTHANHTLVRRLGLKCRGELIGRRASELFPAGMGGSYSFQDNRVLQGETLENQLEVHIFPNRVSGWCLTCKRPLRVRGQIRGVLGISRDLGKPDAQHPTYTRLSRVVAHLQEHYADALRVQALAAQVGVSVAQLERHFRRVFQLTPQQVLTRFRIDAAMRMLSHDTDSVAAIGLACGYADQSAFARQFKLTVGMTPREFRLLRSSG